MMLFCWHLTTISIMNWMEGLKKFEIRIKFGRLRRDQNENNSKLNSVI